MLVSKNHLEMMIRGLRVWSCKLLVRSAIDRFNRGSVASKMAVAPHDCGRYAVFVNGPAPDLCARVYGDYGDLFISLLRRDPGGLYLRVFVRRLCFFL